MTKVNLQYTFIGWDSGRVLPLFPDDTGKEFPAYLTKRAGVENTIIDLLRPLFNKSIRLNDALGISLLFLSLFFSLFSSFPPPLFTKYDVHLYEPKAAGNKMVSHSVESKIVLIHPG